MAETPSIDKKAGWRDGVSAEAGASRPSSPNSNKQLEQSVAANLGDSWVSIGAFDDDVDHQCHQYRPQQPSLISPTDSHFASASATASDGASETTSTSGRELLSMISSASEDDGDDLDQLSELSDWTAEDGSAGGGADDSNEREGVTSVSVLYPSTAQLDRSASFLGPDSTSLGGPTRLMSSSSSMPGTWSTSTSAIERGGGGGGARDIELVYPTIGPLPLASSASTSSSSYFGTDGSGSTIMPTISSDRLKGIPLVSPFSSISNIDIGQGVLTPSMIPGAFTPQSHASSSTTAYNFHSFLANVADATGTSERDQKSLSDRLVADEFGFLGRGGAHFDFANDDNVSVKEPAAVAADSRLRGISTVDDEWLKTVAELNKPNRAPTGDDDGQGKKADAQQSKARVASRVKKL